MSTKLLVPFTIASDIIPKRLDKFLDNIAREK